MTDYPWQTKGIVLTAPLTKDVDDVCMFIDRILSGKVNMIVLQTRYRYQFKIHPECMGYDPLSENDVKKIVDVCKKNNIRLIPKMNLFGHQSGTHNTPIDGILHGHAGYEPCERDGLLRAYPQFDETPELENVFYCRNICPTHPDIKNVLFELVDELLEAFEADAMHIGCDEAFTLGTCPECKKHSNAELFSNWITSVHAHLASKGAETMMWSDRFLSAGETGYGEWEASAIGTESALYSVPKDIILCDWHYGTYGKGYPSIKIFADAGFRMMISPWKDKNAAEAFINYAAEHDCGNIDGVLATTWCSSGELARRFLYGSPCEWVNTPAIVETLRAVYLD